MPTGWSNAMRTSTATRNTRVAYPLHGANGIRNAGRAMRPCCAHDHSRSWHRTMTPHALTMPMAAMFRTISNASAGTRALSTTPSSATTTVSAMPPYGTPLRLTRPANAGAEPVWAIECRMRPVEYSPAFSEDSAAVRTTRFTNASTPSTPTWEKNVTNGLTPFS